MDERVVPAGAPLYSGSAATDAAASLSTFFENVSTLVVNSIQGSSLDAKADAIRAARGEAPVVATGPITDAVTSAADGLITGAKAVVNGVPQGAVSSVTLNAVDVGTIWPPTEDELENGTYRTANGLTQLGGGLAVTGGIGKVAQTAGTAGKIALGYDTASNGFNFGNGSAKVVIEGPTVENVVQVVGGGVGVAGNIGSVAKAADALPDAPPPRSTPAPDPTINPPPASQSPVPDVPPPPSTVTAGAEGVPNTAGAPGGPPATPPTPVPQPVGLGADGPPRGASASAGDEVTRPPGGPSPSSDSSTGIPPDAPTTPSGPPPSAPAGTTHPSSSPVLANVPDGPNPHTYPLGDGTDAYPNMAGPKQIEAELTKASELKVDPIIILPTPDGKPDPAVVKRLTDELGEGDALYVVKLDGTMSVIPAKVGNEPLTHTMASQGDDVLAAGHLKLGPNGTILGYNNQSGHYRPADRQTQDTMLGVLHEAGLR